MDRRAQEILEFWESIGPKGWYEVSDQLDQTIRDRFLGLWEQARAGAFRDWMTNAQSALALIILLDQFPRNMFRGDARSFATDQTAVCLSKRAIAMRLDEQIEGGIRQFFFLPLMHSESVGDQDAAVRAFLTRMPNEENLKHARAHRAVIRSFGRFPYRNEVLGRESSAQERDYLAAGGYRYTLQNLAA